MTRISKEGEYSMKQALDKSIEKVRKNVEKLAIEALQTDNIEKIINHGALIENAVQRIKNLENGKDFSLETKEEFHLFYKTSEDALERLKQHYERIRVANESEKKLQFIHEKIVGNLDDTSDLFIQEDSLMDEDQGTYGTEGTYDIEETYDTEGIYGTEGTYGTEETYDTEGIYGTEYDPEGTYIVTPTLEELYDLQQKAIESDNCNEIVSISNLLEKNCRDLKEMVENLEIPFEKIPEAEDRIDVIAQIIRDLDYRVEEYRRLENAKIDTKIEENVLPDAIYEMYQDVLKTSDIGQMSMVADYFIESYQNLEKMLENGEFVTESEEEDVKKQIDTFKTMVDHIGNRMNGNTEIVDVEENGIIPEENPEIESDESIDAINENVNENILISEEDVDYYYNQAMNTTDRNYLIEVANYLDDCCASYIEYMNQNEMNTSQIENIVEDIKKKVACIDQRLSEFDNDNVQNNNIELWSQEKLEALYDEAVWTADLDKKHEICNFCNQYILELEYTSAYNNISNEEKEQIMNKIQEVEEIKAEIERHIVVFSSLNQQESLNSQESKHNGIKNIFANTSWFKKKEKADKKEKKTSLKRIAVYTIGVGIIAAAIGTFVSAKTKSEQSKKRLTKIEKAGEKIQEASLSMIKQMEKVHKIKMVSDSVSALSQANYSSRVLTQDTKEEQIMDLVRELRDKLNMYDGMNVTIEQALSLYIHLNAANSFENPNDTLALDKITRENLIKKYYVGLTKDMEEFNTYELDDSDLSKLSAAVQELRNAALNRVIVLNDQGKYEESRQIIGIFKKFITEEALQDEAEVLTGSIQAMQTSDKQRKKGEIYRYYNYIFAGPKSDVRNFSQYGHYVDNDGKEMTYENQGTTVRFYTWFMDGFVGINIKNMIPQDIINAKEAKLRDQSNLLRILGFKNCNAKDLGIYYGFDFDTPIDNKVRKSSSTTKSSSKSSSNSSNDNIASVLETSQLDKEMDAKLKEHSNVGDSFKLSDDSTVTVVESGPRNTTVVVQPDSSSAKVEDTTPKGKTEKEIIEGGGNETTETIKFDQDKTEVVIDEGGEFEFEYSESIDFKPDPVKEEYTETISFEEESTEEEYTEIISFEEDSITETVIDEGGKEISEWESTESIYKEPEETEFIYEEQKSVEETYSEQEVIEETYVESEAEISEEYSTQIETSEEYSTQAKISELYSWRAMLLGFKAYKPENTVFDEGYAKIYHI